MHSYGFFCRSLTGTNRSGIECSVVAKKAISYWFLPNEIDGAAKAFLNLVYHNGGVSNAVVYKFSRLYAEAVVLRVRMCKLLVAI